MNNIFVPTQSELKELEIQRQITLIKKNCKSNDPVSLKIGEKVITFYGGQKSSNGISGAVELAQSLNETEVKIWDINNKIHILSLQTAFKVAKKILIIWREEKHKRQEKITALRGE